MRNGSIPHQPFLRLVSLAVGLVIVGCVNKPGWPERDGAKRLRGTGIDAATVERVVQGRKLDQATQARIEKIRNQDVGFLLARNPSLDQSRMRRLSKHRNDFVRSGVARNPALPRELVSELRDDASHTVWVGLAANPSLAAGTLLLLKQERDLEWYWFAMNPACPPEIVAEMERAGDAEALRWLKRTRESLRDWPIEKPTSRQKAP